VTLYYDMDGSPLTLEEWARLFDDTDRRRIGLDHIGVATISTVWIGLDMGVGRIFETLVTGGDYDGYERRYRTMDEAAAGHGEMVELVQRASTLGLRPYVEGDA